MQKRRSQLPVLYDFMVKAHNAQDNSDYLYYFKEEVALKQSFAEDCAFDIHSSGTVRGWTKTMEYVQSTYY